jgi:hypothetical protein
VACVHSGGAREIRAPRRQEFRFFPDFVCDRGRDGLPRALARACADDAPRRPFAAAAGRARSVGLAPVSSDSAARSFSPHPHTRSLPPPPQAWR